MTPPPPRVLAYHKPAGEVVSHDGTQKAMNRVNAKEKKPEPAPPVSQEPSQEEGEAQGEEPGAV